MATLLEASGAYKILRKLEFQHGYVQHVGTPTRRGIYLDVETTGLDPTKDEIIELAMVPFDYSADGRIIAIHEPFNRLRSPGRPLSAEVVSLTGIKDEMLEGALIGPAEVTSFAAAAGIVVAHNAAFDRCFAERFCDTFEHKAWACSMAEVPWAAEGFNGVKLVHLAAGHGFFFDGHRAVHDCFAGLEILSRMLPGVAGRACLYSWNPQERHAGAFGPRRLPSN